jgi:hypothetical protein
VATTWLVRSVLAEEVLLLLQLFLQSQHNTSFSHSAPHNTFNTQHSSHTIIMPPKRAQKTPTKASASKSAASATLSSSRRAAAPKGQFDFQDPEKIARQERKKAKEAKAAAEASARIEEDEEEGEEEEQVQNTAQPTEAAPAPRALQGSQEPAVARRSPEVVLNESTEPRLGGTLKPGPFAKAREAQAEEQQRRDDAEKQRLADLSASQLAMKAQIKSRRLREEREAAEFASSQEDEQHTPEPVIEQSPSYGAKGKKRKARSEDESDSRGPAERAQRPRRNNVDEAQPQPSFRVPGADNAAETDLHNLGIETDGDADPNDHVNDDGRLSEVPQSDVGGDAEGLSTVHHLLQGSSSHFPSLDAEFEGLTKAQRKLTLHQAQNPFSGSGRLHGDQTVGDVLNRSTGITITPAMISGTERMWDMCLRCMYHLHLGEQLPTRLCGAFEAVLTYVLLLGNTCIGGVFKASTARRCTRCADNNTGCKFNWDSALTPGLNRAASAWITWMQVILDGSAEDVRRAFQLFHQANHPFQKELAAFKSSKNKVVGNQATPHHARGGGGFGGFDASSLVQHQRVAASMESQVDLAALVSRGFSA